MALAGCGPQESQSAGGKTQIRFATDWRAQAEQGGFYQALARGFYADKGLDVTLIQGGPSVNIPQLLAANAIEMGLGSNAPIVLSMVQAGAKARAVMASFQKDPQVLITHPRADIKSLADMKGKPIMLADASITAFWPWLKAKYGFSDAQVRKYTFNSAPFLADPNAIQQGYITSEPYTLKKQGKIDPQVFLLADAGYPGYAAMTLVSERFIARDGGAVRDFVEATIAGWQDYLHFDPAPGDGLIITANPDMTHDLLAQARDKLLAYGIVETPAGEIGTMTLKRWREFFSMMAAAGIYPKDMNWESGIDLSFLPKAT
ncbi:ABC transporter substrate-binding protein [Candidatus Phycosocius spiralis]|uniref:ABC transporter substrate-binding protein n=2 Tax=Candidatus Phycosocius spiralis TaxID=2815099 RepID=A0ABQ4PTV0_9PROT|nr:ABC transporter substrate-binding protein [Candidatus Phycosocius spiralis]